MTGQLSRIEPEFDRQTSAEMVKRYGRAIHSGARMTAIYVLLYGQKIAEAQAKLPHGEFLPWLENDCGISRSTAYNYLALFSQKGAVLAKFPTVGNLVLKAPADWTRDDEAVLDKASANVLDGKSLKGIYTGIVRTEPLGRGGDNEWAAWLKKHHPALLKDGAAPKRNSKAVGAEVWQEWQAHLHRKLESKPAEREHTARACLAEATRCLDGNILHNPNLKLLQGPAHIAALEAFVQTATRAVALINGVLKEIE